MAPNKLQLSKVLWLNHVHTVKEILTPIQNFRKLQLILKSLKRYTLSSDSQFLKSPLTLVFCRFVGIFKVAIEDKYLKKTAQRGWTPGSLKKFNPTKIRTHLQFYIRILFKIESDQKRRLPK